MRKNTKKVFDLQNELIKSITDWFEGKDFEEIEFKRMFTIQVDVEHSFIPDEYGIEFRVAKYLTNSEVINSDGDDVSLNNLSCSELAFILDELDEQNYLITN